MPAQLRLRKFERGFQIEERLVFLRWRPDRVSILLGWVSVCECGMIPKAQPQPARSCHGATEKRRRGGGMVGETAVLAAQSA